MSEAQLARWQARFFAERVSARSSGRDGVYFREQVFGGLQVLSDALPELHEALGEANFRFFVREFLTDMQPRDALGVTLVEPFLEFLRVRPELAENPEQLDCIHRAIQTL
jgi:hypothetical protein